MDELKKKIVIGYCVAIILSILIVPWKIDYKTESYTTKINKGYSFVLSPPIPVATIDFSKIFLEFVLITAVAGIIYVMRDKFIDK